MVHAIKMIGYMHEQTQEKYIIAIFQMASVH